MDWKLLAGIGAVVLLVLIIWHVKLEDVVDEQKAKLDKSDSYEADADELITE